MPLLSIEDYAAAEEFGLQTTPNRIVECAMPVAFNHVGYPTRVSTARALSRFVDVMHEGRTVGTFRDILLGGISDDELMLLEKVSSAVRRLTAERYGKAVVPTGSLLRALNVVRQIRFLHPEPDTLVFEIGHGSGYVGALLLAAGYRYASTDIAQAFYIYQNHLLNTIAPGKVIDLVDDVRPFSDFVELPPGSALHVPWWKFMVPSPAVLLKADVVTCNHALCEMHVNSLTYAIKMTRQLLAGARHTCFLFEGWGSTAQSQIWVVAKRFADLGFVVPHMDIWAAVFATKESSWAQAGALALPQPWRTDAVTNVAAYPEAAFVAMFHPPIYSNQENALSRQLIERRDAFRPQATRGLADIEAMWRRVLGADDLVSDDEKFIQFVERIDY